MYIKRLCCNLMMMLPRTKPTQESTCGVPQGGSRPKIKIIFENKIEGTQPCREIKKNQCMHKCRSPIPTAKIFCSILPVNLK